MCERCLPSDWVVITFLTRCLSERALRGSVVLAGATCWWGASLPLREVRPRLACGASARWWWCVHAGDRGVSSSSRGNV